MTYFVVGIAAIVLHWVFEAFIVSVMWMLIIKPGLQWVGFLAVV